MVPHRGTNWAALWLTAQIGRDAVLSESYGRGYQYTLNVPYICRGEGAFGSLLLLLPILHA